MKKIARSQRVWHYLVENRITWQFIVERAPWWGGFWERLVRSIKRPLKRVIGRSTLTYDELHTILVEIEGIIKARPLTYVYDDEESSCQPLTPSHLIYGRRITGSPNSSHHEVISTNHSLTRRARHHKRLLQQLTTQWRREYLTSLREQATTDSNREEVNSAMSEGDIVIVKNDSTARAFWRLARIEQLLHGKDGKVRAAVIKIGSGHGKPVITRRAIQHLVPIEVKSDSRDVPPINNKENDGNLTAEPEATESRIRRRAAVIGEIRRRDQNIDILK